MWPCRQETVWIVSLPWGRSPHVLAGRHQRADDPWLFAGGGSTFTPVQLWWFFLADDLTGRGNFDEC